MGEHKLNDSSWLISILFILFCTSCFVQCQTVTDPSQLNNPAVLDLVTQLVYAQLSNMTAILNSELQGRSSFCIKDPQADWDRAFNYSSNLEFLSRCILKTNGDITNRLCTAAEVKFYFRTFFDAGGNNYLKPNRNCNLTSWLSGCEPGWACSSGQNQNVDMRNSQEIPIRSEQCDTCCEGFFCPHGLTCMIPCPLGAYCPQATLNITTGVCNPYTYQLPPGHKNHTCGGANVWGDVRSSGEVFCSAGSYCPTTVDKIPCSSGHYCRTGSTSEKRCFKLTACNPNTANQNMHAYGAMLIAGLVTMLLIFYNCSDQVLTIRERRLAKSRETAARNAKETTKARERWRHAKSIAMKSAAGLQAHFSFSRRRSSKHLDESKHLCEIRMLDLDENKIEEEDNLYPLPMMNQGDGNSSKQKLEGMEKEPSHQIMNEIETEPNSNVKPEKKNLKQRHGKEKMIHTRSEIFNYAYTQLEREKALQEQNKDLTFSGVVTMATNNPETKRRPLIEITFKDLTITLKGKNKHLLRCVTGKIKPGRITAVMGPSGAGKTTFLSAIVGKIMGCNITGQILINGVNESIHSYKKIIGFVPQDDIVHGNLTVEENLWFNARCRLSADLSKAEKVLVVERVIESLGLQGVRDSLVGTVEKRGISGGQRKRVNVGLEMVMEPSLLILDEPTSGLDSSSSMLLLRSLRREALEGVNISMVVHQPSYALFKMFDDLILLAKGGFIVYHGPMKKAEEYFAGLGINIPDRVNPPDHFIDYLEGLVKPAENGVRHEELPVRWMLHNGYQVPTDLKQTAPEPVNLIINTNGNDVINQGDVTVEDHSFAGDLWQNVKSTAGMHHDKIRHNFLNMKDLSKRRTPGVYVQYKYFLGRVGKQRLRESRLQAIDYLILLLAGACLGSLAKGNDASFGSNGYTYTIIAISLLCKIAALRSFSLDKLQYWRESSSGMSSLAYFLAKDTIDHSNTLIKPVVYLSMFYFFNTPRSSFFDNYIVMVCLVYAVTGIAYALAIFLESGPAQLWSVLLPVIITLVATQPRDSAFMRLIAQLCYSKWALQAFVIANAERYYGVWLITRCGTLLRTGYDLHDWGLCLGVLMLIGVGCRTLAFIGMVTFKRK